MNKFLLSIVTLTTTFVMASLIGLAHADNTIICPPGTTCIVPNNPTPAPAPVPIPVPIPQYVPIPVPTLPPPETWWIYNWVQCYNDFGDCIVNIDVDGLNVRDDNNNVQFAVVNGTPFHIVDRNGRWLKVTFSCPLVYTGFNATATGIPIYACQ